MFKRQIQISMILTHLRLMEDLCGFQAPIFYNGMYLRSCESLFTNTKIQNHTIHGLAKEISTQRYLFISLFKNSVKMFKNKILNYEKPEKQALTVVIDMMTSLFDKFIERLLTRLDKVESGFVC